MYYYQKRSLSIAPPRRTAVGLFGNLDSSDPVIGRVAQHSYSFQTLFHLSFRFPFEWLIRGVNPIPRVSIP